MQFDSVGGTQPKKGKRSVPFRYLCERGSRLATYAKLAELVDNEVKNLTKPTNSTTKAAKITKHTAFRDALTSIDANASEASATEYPFYISKGVDLGIPVAISSIQMHVHVIGILPIFHSLSLALSLSYVGTCACAMRDAVG